MCSLAVVAPLHIPPQQYLTSPNHGSKNENMLSTKIFGSCRRIARALSSIDNIHVAALSNAIEVPLGTTGTIAPARLQPHAFAIFDVNFVGTGGSNPSRFRGMPSMTLFLGEYK